MSAQIIEVARKAGLDPKWCRHVVATIQMTLAYGYVMTADEIADTIRSTKGLAGTENYPAPCPVGSEQDIARAILAAMAALEGI